MNAQNPLHWTLNWRFGVFRTIGVHSGPFWLSYETRCKTGRTNAKVCATKSHWNFSQESTRSTPLDPKLMFSLFCTIWVHLGPFGCLTKLSAKRAELVRNFVPRSRIEIFRNKRTRSTYLDPKLMFRWVLYHLVAFGTIWLPYETRCKIGRTSAKVCATKSHRSFSRRTQPIHPIGP